MIRGVGVSGRSSNIYKQVTMIQRVVKRSKGVFVVLELIE